MKRVLRILGASVFLPPLVIVATVVGTLLAVLMTPPGHRLLARVATRWISGSVAGRVEIGGIGGTIWGGIQLDRVAIHDSSGALVFSAPQVRATYTLSELVQGHLVFHDVHLETPIIHLVQGQDRRWNYEAVFRVAKSTGGAKGSSHVEFYDLTINDGSVRVDVATVPKPVRQPTSPYARPPAMPRIDTTADGPKRVYTAEHLTTSLSHLRLATPRHDPILARINSLRAQLSDPKVTIVDLKGVVLTAGDSLRFTFAHAELPGSSLRGTGAVRWPNDTTLFDYQLNADRVALEDLLWISPDFPKWRGSGRVVAKSSSGSRTDYLLENLALGDARQGIQGRTVLIVDLARGLGMRGLDLALRDVSLDVMRPYLDTIPFAGRLSGRIAGDGFLDGLALRGDLLFADSLAAGQPSSRFPIDGTIHFGGADGAVFDEFKLDRAVVALATVRRISPSILLHGEMHLTGRLNGPWQNVRFDGTSEHVASNSAVSRLLGMVRLDTRHEVLGLGMDATFDRLSFDALRTGYPALTAQGGLSGRVIANGTLAALDVDARLSGEIGTVDAKGRIAALAPKFAAESLVVAVQRLNMEAILGTGSSTALNGRLWLTASVDSGVPPEGRAEISLDRSRVGGMAFDAAEGVFRFQDRLLHVDTAWVAWGNGTVAAHGALGFAAPDSGSLAVHASMASLTPLDSLVRAVTGLVPDTLHPRPLDGAARAELALHGAIGNARITGTVEATDLVLDGYRVSPLTARFSADSLGARALRVEVAADSVVVGDRQGEQVRLLITGRRDSLAVAGGGRTLNLAVRGGGTWFKSAGNTALILDSLALDFPRQRWRLQAPARIGQGVNLSTLADTLRLASLDGAGTLQVAGTIPSADPGDLVVNAVGIDLVDVYGVLQRDTTALGGLASLDLRMGGTRYAPTFRGSASVTGAVAGDARPPLVHAAFDYQQQRLRSHLTFWKTGDPIFEVDVSVPYDLAFAPRVERRLPGPIEITGVADSLDLVLLEALTPSIKDARGLVHLDLRATGSWSAPRLNGTLRLTNGSMRLPALNVTYRDIQGAARFVDDSLAIDTLRMRSGDGSLLMSGNVRFAPLNRPSLDLRIRTDRFLAIDVDGFLLLRPSGAVTLRGPLTQPVLAGDQSRGVTLSSSVIYFTDLVSKTVLDLENPAIADLVDTTALHKQGLGSAFQSRFLDSLRIDALDFRLGDDVWLRSSDANIQLEGDVTVSKEQKQYNLTGIFTTNRGSYTLRGYTIARDFTVRSGTVRYTGQPDLNADLDIKAETAVRTPDGDEVPIVATINGTIRAPRVNLSSPGRNFSQLDLASLLVVGRPQAQAVGAINQQQLAQNLLSTLTGEVSNLLANNTVRLQIRPTLPTERNAASLTQLGAGIQLGPKTFVSLNAGFCLGRTGSGLQRQNLGASLEYRVSRTWRIQAAAEPVQSCGTRNDIFTSPRRYQLGGDLIWTKDY